MYDLKQLSDYDFEHVVADLLRAEWQVRVEYFPKGRDGGVDLRVLGPTSEPLNLPAQTELIVQCKHMPDATIAQLRRPLREEASKQIVSEAYRYVFATSARLTRANKREIVGIFAGRVSEADIFGRDDVDSLLKNHPDVVRANVKLWLTGEPAMQAFLNQVEHLRSNLLQAELERLRPRFVQTAVVAAAQRVLARFGVCILAGPPGVGKTTTAQVLLLQYLSEGWRPIVAVSDVRELETQILPDIKQVFFFDDFLGATALPSKLARGEDSALVRLIHLIESDPNKAFILTTRDYILRQAQQAYEKMNDEVFSIARLLIDVKSLSSSERAHILYNQLFFSPLRNAAAAAPDGPRRYMALTRHPNYNPRLIEAAIAAANRDLRISSSNRPAADTQNEDDIARVANSGREMPDVPSLIQRALDHPEQLWEHVLLYQLTRLQREILITRLSLGAATVGISDFASVAIGLAEEMGSKPTRLDFDMTLNVLDGDLLSVTEQFSETDRLVVKALHPGVTDSLVAMLRRYPENMLAITASASTFEQVRWLAESLGLLSPSRSRKATASTSLPPGLVECAERNLLAPPIAIMPGLFRRKPPHEFFEFGTRLEALSSIYAGTAQQSTADFADQIVPRFLANISKVPDEELVRVLRALQGHVFREWRWRRTEINVAVLGQLDNPDDIKGWSLLRDAVDLVEPTQEYCSELRNRFEEFLNESTSNAEDIIDEAEEGDDVDVDSPLDEMAELEELANRWGVFPGGIGDLVENLQEIKDRRDEAEAEQMRLERRMNQPTLFDTPRPHPEPKRDNSIFDHL